MANIAKQPEFSPPVLRGQPQRNTELSPEPHLLPGASLSIKADSLTFHYTAVLFLLIVVLTLKKKQNEAI